VRQQKGWSHQDVAAQVGIAPDVYLRMERGRLMPGTSTFARLCLVLDMEADMACGLADFRKRPYRAEPPGLSRHLALTRVLRKVRSLPPPMLALFINIATLLANTGGSPSPGPSTGPESSQGESE
jgi:transcriptional regulator with XRE-family HTH domain